MLLLVHHFFPLVEICKGTYSGQKPTELVRIKAIAKIAQDDRRNPGDISGQIKNADNNGR
jgi:hypothetical protein